MNASSYDANGRSREIAIVHRSTEILDEDDDTNDEERRYGTRSIEESSTQFTVSGLTMSWSIQTLDCITSGLLGLGIIVFCFEIKLIPLKLFDSLRVIITKFTRVSRLVRVL